MKSKCTSMFFMLALLATACSSGNNEKYYEKTMEFPADADSITKIEMAAHLVPSAKQLAWQNLELTAFLHFGMNTFTDREWGNGEENPAIFNPQALDAEQWVKALKEAGFKMVILTAKHHDGFCLWPTKTTNHSVASSPWRDGQGDVVADLKNACDKYGMKLGLYLSPWDRNAECYGDSPRYNDMFVEQLTEILSNYGPIDEVWFDGACGEGPNGKKQEYDWARFKEVIERLQPDAVTAIMGDDVRWVGNERGQGRETEWNATALTPGILPNAEESNQKLDIYDTASDLGSRALVAKADQLHWWPSEVDVSIRPGWFYHDTEEPKSLFDLANIYLTSIGRNSVLLLNIPPNRDGLISDSDVQRLMELRQWIDTNFSHNLAASIDNNVAQTEPNTRVNCILLKEDISKGQRVEEFEVLGQVNGEWVPLTQGTTIGYKRILMFPDTEVDAVKVNVTSSRAETNLLPFELYRVEMPAIEQQAQSKYAEAPQADWKVVNASGSVADAAKAIDNNEATYWQSEVSTNPKEIVVDMGQALPIAGFVYRLVPGDDKSGTIFKYRFFTSNDGTTWKESVTPREFSNIVNNPIDQRVYFATPENARYFKLIGDSEIEGRDYVTIGDLSILTL